MVGGRRSAIGDRKTARDWRAVFEGGAQYVGRISCGPIAYRRSPIAASQLLPRQPLTPPTAERATMVVLVERALEPLEDVEHFLETGFLEGQAGIHRPVTAAADQHDRAVHAG